MTGLKLVNNTGLRSEKNLCFVNSTLQLLHSIPDVREFFKTKEYRKDHAEHLLVCDEISRIFQTEGLCRTSAAELRRLTGQHYGREDICDGIQQDMEEFTRLLLDQIEDELSAVSYMSSRIMNKFWGKEKNRRLFMNAPNGTCKQGHVPRTEEERFRTIRLPVPDTSRELSLNNMIHNHFAENTDTIKMKCSDCCQHSRDCPQTGNCRQMDASTQKCLIETPTFLFIQLLRFDHHINAKIESTVVPENILFLPNGDKYKLLSIGNHLGTFINNGHYQALVKAGTSVHVHLNQQQKQHFHQMIKKLRQRRVKIDLRKTPSKRIVLVKMTIWKRI